MGSTLSAIRDDEDEYYYLCQKFSVKPDGGVYSPHHFWLSDKSDNKTNLTFEEYLKEDNIKKLKNKIEYYKRELKSFEDDLKSLLDEK